MRNIISSTVVLAIVVFIASFSLSHVNKITYPNILRQAKEKERRALSTVLPGYSNIKVKEVIIDGKDFLYWTGVKRKNRKTIKGYAFITEKSGYSGLVRTMVGVNMKGVILGISILQQSETPGLGARSIEIASKQTFFGYLFGTSPSEEEPTIPWFQEQFRGLNTSKRIEIVKKGDWDIELREELLKENAISAITGATITTRVVRDSIDEGFQRLRVAQKMMSRGRRLE